LEPDGPLERALRREAVRFGVSRSFVLHTLASMVLQVEDQPNYMDDAKPRRHLRLVKKRA
ncbi:MAG TPA: hypothetical protein VFP27_09890, partial [Mycobacterium sp.]|nr:hypothetical protein [Mycobacterium sp.]